MWDLSNCTLCPRHCAANRYQGRGFCKAPSAPLVARAMLHFGEEPCISGINGSGAVFFGGCNLACVFCQNYELSHKPLGIKISVQRLSEIFLELQEKGAHNINLVSAAPYLPFILEALDKTKNKLHIPIVYNSSGYESTESLQALKGYIDIYLPDFKYVSGELSAAYSAASDYFEVAGAAIHEMIAQLGHPQFDKNGIMQKGVIIRHLILPGASNDSCNVLEWLAQELPQKSFFLSLMSQYTPAFLHGEFPNLQRPLTAYEYRKVLNKAVDLKLTQGYMQDRNSSDCQYTPEFNLEGVK